MTRLYRDGKVLEVEERVTELEARLATMLDTQATMVTTLAAMTELQRSIVDTLALLKPLVERWSKPIVFMEGQGQ